MKCQFNHNEIMKKCNYDLIHCICGKLPELNICKTKEYDKTYPYYAQVRCECGITDSCFCCNDAEEQAIKQWNERMYHFLFGD